jgi:hypothetical protein
LVTVQAGLPTFRHRLDRRIIPGVTLPQALAAVVDLQHAHRELLRTVDALKPADWERGVPYGEWTVKDLIAHCIGDMSPSGPGLIAAGVLTPQFIAETSETFDVRQRNQAMVEERRRYTPEDLRQLLFEAHDAKIEATLRLNESHLQVLDYNVPMGTGYDIKVLDWLWYGYHDREHADDLRRALAVDWAPQVLTFIPELEDSIRLLVRGREGLLRAIYSVADDAWDERAVGEGQQWTNKDVLAHVATNDLRPQARFRGVMGQWDEDEQKRILQTNEWNEEMVSQARGKSVRETIDTMQANRHDTMVLISRLKPEHITATVRFADGREVSIQNYVGFLGEHDSMHAGQLVAASRARRS